MLFPKTIRSMEEIEEILKRVDGKGGRWDEEVMKILENSLAAATLCDTILVTLSRTEICCHSQVILHSAPAFFEHVMPRDYLNVSIEDALGSITRRVKVYGQDEDVKGMLRWLYGRRVSGMPDSRLLTPTLPISPGAFTLEYSATGSLSPLPTNTMSSVTTLPEIPPLVPILTLAKSHRISSLITHLRTLMLYLIPLSTTEPYLPSFSRGLYLLSVSPYEDHLLESCYARVVAADYERLSVVPDI